MHNVLGYYQMSEITARKKFFFEHLKQYVEIRAHRNKMQNLEPAMYIIWKHTLILKPAGIQWL